MRFEPIDWLRGKAKQKAATGGIVTAVVSAAHAAELINLPTGYLMPTSIPEPTGPQPSGFIRFTDELTEEQVQQFRESFQALALPQPKFSGEALQCPCVVIYSRCYYGHA